MLVYHKKVPATYLTKIMPIDMWLVLDVITNETCLLALNLGGNPLWAVHGTLGCPSQPPIEPIHPVDLLLS